MGHFVDLSGETFGRLTAHNVIGRNKHNQLLWRCTCECGTEKAVLGMCLRRGEIQSCGCYHKERTSAVHTKHGKTRTPIYAVWRSMMQRCYDKNSHAYNRYGGRGINVCPEWQSFEGFYKDMGDRPEGKSLERINNDGDYAPENVIWADAKAQARNRRSTVFIEHNGERKSLAEWSELSGVKLQTLWARIFKHGLDVGDALKPGDRRYAA